MSELLCHIDICGQECKQVMTMLVLINIRKLLKSVLQVEDKYGMKVEIIKDESNDVDPEVCFMLFIFIFASDSSFDV